MTDTDAWSAAISAHHYDSGAELFLEALVHEREHFRAPEARDDDRAGRCLAASEAVHGRNVITLVKSWSLEARQHALLVEEFRPCCLHHMFWNNEKVFGSNGHLAAIAEELDHPSVPIAANNDGAFAVQLRLLLQANDADEGAHGHGQAKQLGQTAR